jgi:hypothetical protein
VEGGARFTIRLPRAAPVSERVGELIGEAAS